MKTATGRSYKATGSKYQGGAESTDATATEFFRNQVS